MGLITSIRNGVLISTDDGGQLIGGEEILRFDQVEIAGPIDENVGITHYVATYCFEEKCWIYTCYSGIEKAKDALLREIGERGTQVRFGMARLNAGV